MAKKDISNLKLTGIHKIAMKPLKIEVEIQPDNVIVRPIPTVIDELFD